MNPGGQTANVGCTYFTSNGLLDFARGQSRTAAPGAMVGFGPGGNFLGWVLIISDQPVIPFGYVEDFDDQTSSKHVMQFHLLDCSKPTGIEFACMFVAQ